MKATVTSKGQITIPQAIRTKEKIVAGSQLEFQIEDDNTLIVHLITHEVADLKGMVKSKRQRPPSLKEMKQAISMGASGVPPARTPTTPVLQHILLITMLPRRSTF